MRSFIILHNVSRLIVLGFVGLFPLMAWAQYADEDVLQTALKADEKLVPLGTLLFHDTSFSNPPGQSCATCHQQEHAFTDGGTVAEGATKGIFGSRNTPSLTYAKYAAPFLQSEYSAVWVGGFFWDGRVGSLEEQALEPFFNPLEMNSDEKTFASQLRKEPYKKQFLKLFGEKVVSDDRLLVEAAAKAIASFERTDIFSPFTSKFDYVRAGKATFTKLEEMGQAVYEQGGMCSECHLGLTYDKRQMFTGYEHHNIVLPTNNDSEFLKQDVKHNPAGDKYIDVGLALNPKVAKKYLAQSKGLFRTPTLRNISLTAPYMHNGVFSTLREVIDFYNRNNKESRDKIGPAEIPENRSETLSSSLELSEKDIEALIAFLNTLTDGYQPPKIAPKESIKPVAKMAN